MTPRLVVGLLLLAALPFLSLLGHPGEVLADPLGEVPVKLWLHETMAEVGLFGGHVGTVGFPHLGLLNNPDPLGTALTALLRPLLGRAGAWNLSLYLGLLANGAAMAWLLRRLGAGEAAALTAAAAFALTPMVLVQALAGAVTETLYLWPWVLAMGLFLQALARGGSLRPALGAGLCAGLGVVASAYNGIVFGALAFPGLAWLALSWGRPALPGGQPLGAGALLRTVAPTAVGALLVVLPLAAWTSHVMSAGESLLPAEAVQATRHVAPYLDLRPTVPDRYTTYLADWVAVGKGALVERELAARFYRACSPGLLVLALAVWALGRGRPALLWALGAVFCVLASTGPFLPVHGGLYAESPINPAWLLLHHLLPGARLLLEPFRYALAAVACLSVLAGLGAAALAPRLGRLAWLLPVLVAAEVVALSPTPAPLPTTPVTVPAVYADLPLPAGAVVELPYFDGDSDRFVRRHFLQQRVHGRPIPDAVVGFPAPWLVGNGFTSRLLSLERTSGPLSVVPTGDPQEGLQALRAAGFAGIVVEPGRYASPEVARGARELLDAALGPPVEVDARWIYALR